MYHVLLKPEGAVASGMIRKATPRVCWQSGPVHVSLVVCGQSRQSQCQRQHRGH